MKFVKLPKSIMITIISIFTVTLLSACGGGGDSSAGTGSFSVGSSTITGNVSNGVAYQRPVSSELDVLLKMVDVIVPQAQAAGVAGVTVELYLDGAKVSEQGTDAAGNFIFDNLSPGNYNIQVVQNGRAMGKSPAIQLDANTNTRIGMRVDGGLLGVEVEARNSAIRGEVENHTDDQNQNDQDTNQNDDGNHDANDDNSDGRNDDNSDNHNDDSDNHDANDDSDHDSNDDHDKNDDDCNQASCDDDSKRTSK